MSGGYDFTLSKLYLHISPEPSEHVIEEHPATVLLDKRQVAKIMHDAGQLVQARDMRLPVSFLGTSLCHLCLTKLLFVRDVREGALSVAPIS